MCLCDVSPTALKGAFDSAKYNMDAELVSAVMRGLALPHEVMYRDDVVALRRAWIAYKPFYEMRGH